MVLDDWYLTYIVFAIALLERYAIVRKPITVITGQSHYFQSALKIKEMLA